MRLHPVLRVITVFRLIVAGSSSFNSFNCSSSIYRDSHLEYIISNQAKITKLKMAKSSFSRSIVRFKKKHRNSSNIFCTWEKKDWDINHVFYCSFPNDCLYLQTWIFYFLCLVKNPLFRFMVSKLELIYLVCNEQIKDEWISPFNAGF